MTCPLGSHRNTPTPVVNHVKSSDSQIFSRYSHVFPIFHSLKLMSPTLSTQKPFIISSPIFHLLVDGWTVFTLYFQALAILNPWGARNRQKSFHFFPPVQQVPKETGLEGVRCFHLLWAEGFGSPRVSCEGPVMKPWIGGWSWKLQRFFMWKISRKNPAMGIPIMGGWHEHQWNHFHGGFWWIYKNPWG